MILYGDLRPLVYNIYNCVFDLFRSLFNNLHFNLNNKILKKDQKEEKEANDGNTEWTLTRV